MITLAPRLVVSIQFLFLIVLLAAGSAASAQDLSLSGTVTDAQSAAIPGADVRVVRADGLVTRTAVSDAVGRYAIGGLPAGVFVVEVGGEGFRRQTEVVTLASPGTATLNIELAVAGIDDTVVVTAAGVPQAALEASKAITIIESADILARNETSLSDVVRFTPGVQVRNSGGPGQHSSMRIRGLRPDAAAVLIDGMRFRDAATIQADATSFLSTLNFVAADRVEVLRGSGSSLYGTNAVGGVVNIVTRAGGGGLRAEGQVEGGSLGHVRARGSFGGGAWNDRVRYSGGALQFNLLDGLDGNDSNRSTGLSGLVEMSVTPSATIMARVFGSNDRVQLNASPTASGIPAANIPQSIVVSAVPVTPDQIALSDRGLPFQIGSATFIPARDDPDSERTSAFHTTALRFRHSAWQAVSWQASYQHVYTRRVFINGVRGPGFQPAGQSLSHIVGQIDTADVRAFLAPRPWVHLTAGYEFERERFRDRQDSDFAARRVQTGTQIRQDANAAFATAQFALADRRLQVSISGRAQSFTLSNPRLMAVGATSPYDGIAVASPQSALTGDVSAAYFVGASDTKLRVHAGNAFRAPAMYERFGGGFDADPVTGRVGFTPYGDPRLEPDRYQTIDAGVDQYLAGGRLMVSATAFHNNISSLTAFDFSGGIRPETDPYGRFLGYLNSSGGFSRGVETAVEARPTASLRLSGGYTYTRSETAEDITVPGFFLVPGVFAHITTFVVTHRWNNRIDTTFDVFRGGRMYGSFFAAGRTRAFAYPGFTKAAVVAGYRFVDHARAPVRAYVKVDNLFNATYYDTGWRALGRTAVAGLSVGF